ncbi:MAG TPA: hypothetical protein VMU30_12105 [Bacteroidota bacterium]|nr:hypothetical protein [Bacteroidota bacterium]
MTEVFEKVGDTVIAVSMKSGSSQWLYEIVFQIFHVTIFRTNFLKLAPRFFISIFLSVRSD